MQRGPLCIVYDNKGTVPTIYSRKGPLPPFLYVLYPRYPSSKNTPMGIEWFIRFSLSARDPVKRD